MPEEPILQLVDTELPLQKARYSVVKLSAEALLKRELVGDQNEPSLHATLAQRGENISEVTPEQVLKRFREMITQAFGQGVDMHNVSGILDRLPMSLVRDRCGIEHYNGSCEMRPLDFLRGDCMEKCSEKGTQRFVLDARGLDILMELGLLPVSKMVMTFDSVDSPDDYEVMQLPLHQNANGDCEVLVPMQSGGTTWYEISQYMKFVHSKRRNSRDLTRFYVDVDFGRVKFEDCGKNWEFDFVSSVPDVISIIYNGKPWYIRVVANEGEEWRFVVIDSVYGDPQIDPPSMDLGTFKKLFGDCPMARMKLSF